MTSLLTSVAASPTAALPAGPAARNPAPRPILSPGTLGRTALALVALGLLTLPVLAEESGRLTLRGDITARRDVITLGDLVEGAPAALSARPLFRAPPLGTGGTIQVRRIVEAAVGLGLEPPESGGRLQVSVQRAARRIAGAEIEAALRAELARTRGLDAGALTIAFEGEAPAISVPPELDGTVSAQELVYDPRTRRVSALVTVGARQASLRVAGQVIETTEVAVLTRALARGEALGPADVAVERRPREGVPADASGDPSGLVGQVAQRALPAGQPLRGGDLVRPDLVARGETVTIVYETPGIALSLRGQAKEGGPLGAVVAVVNPTSKKVIQATVIGPGRVTVGPSAAEPPAPGRVASAATPERRATPLPERN
ncbi:hypothetical protein OPKNFCMD_3120 [Methylobacterium crusticola]|uniref:SAF domain-containing protein n=1 Tax=Methylobacterium crusticola TaxID=1697972 RepID=A0ABQ4QZB0_9HYPH|nr:flagellar basal body P-ring formation chaperone FlgA [Methylobacterium crusticola]GJD50381.1 hypothetical protein OPKNFCMD_3120 [Methylobacterium crusticola]